MPNLTPLTPENIEPKSPEEAEAFNIVAQNLADEVDKEILNKMTGAEQCRKILMSYMEPCTCSDGYVVSGRDDGEPLISLCPICNGDRYLRKKEVQVDWTEFLGEMIESGQVKFPGIKGTF